MYQRRADLASFGPRLSAHSLNFVNPQSGVCAPWMKIIHAVGGTLFTYFYDFNFYVYFSLWMCCLCCFRTWRWCYETQECNVVTVVNTTFPVTDKVISGLPHGPLNTLKSLFTQLVLKVPISQKWSRKFLFLCNWQFLQIFLTKFPYVAIMLWNSGM